MNLTSIVRVEPGYVSDPKAIQYATENVTHNIVRLWLQGYPNSSLLLRRAQNITTDIDKHDRSKLHAYQATATVIPIPQHTGERLLSFQEIFVLVDAFYRNHGIRPNTLLLPPGFRFEISGNPVRELYSSYAHMNASDSYFSLLGQLKLVDNAPMLAVALL